MLYSSTTLKEKETTHNVEGTATEPLAILLQLLGQLWWTEEMLGKVCFPLLFGGVVVLHVLVNLLRGGGKRKREEEERREGQRNRKGRKR